MDRTLLPYIFSLVVFLAGFGPLARRVGARANLWLISWFLLLGYYLANLFLVPGQVGTLALRMIAACAIDLCGVAFVIASANWPKRRLGRRQVILLTVPILLQSLFSFFSLWSPWPEVVACILYVSPLVDLLLRPRIRSRQTNVVAFAFALLGLAMIPVAGPNPQLVTQATLGLLFLSAAYLYYCALEHFTRADIVAITGLAGWGLSYPLVMVLQVKFPTLVLDHTLVSIPRYLTVVGVMLTLLEEHVERTERLAMHDPLTDLPNRRLFEQRLIATMDDARVNRTTVACLVIDVDNFKHINDTLGHTAGDQLLRALAIRLSWHMSPRDILARTGGDEFTALLAGVNDEHHLRFIAGAMMSAGSVPIVIDGNPVDVRISIGIALSPDHADDIDSLRRAADAAMYTAKRRGGAMLAFADEE